MFAVMQRNLAKAFQETSINYPLSYFSRKESTEGLKSHATVYFSGIQPTGVPHLGNYYGFIEQWLNIQNTEPSTSKLFLSIVDYHAISTGYLEREKMRENIISMAAGLLACGVDPKRTVLFQQSAVYDHANLMFILGSLQTVARLQRLPQYKDKAKRYSSGNVPVNLLIYPVLQAADVLLYKGTHVPVGDDQSQHMNLMCDLARHFNSICQIAYFPIPVQVNATHKRIRSLQNPLKKMSKSDPSKWSRIELSDSRGDIFAKCRKALSDFEANITFEPERRPAISSLVTLYCAVNGMRPEEVVKAFDGMNTKEFKEKLAENLDKHFAPIREKYEQLMVRGRNDVIEILNEGASQARDVAQRNINEIKDMLGMKL